MKKPSFVFLFLVLACVSVFAQKPEIFQKDGSAIGGYDVVAFHTTGKPVMGTIAYQWKDAKWLFVDQSNLEKFKADPEKYAPQYGGYCAYGTSKGYKAPTETDTWTVDGGKLYFNYNKKVQGEWNKDRKGFIEVADKNWPGIRNN